MATTYNIGGETKTLEELKQFFPYGLHGTKSGFTFHAISYAAPAYPSVNNNHGWKLHGDLRKQLSLEEALGKLGLSPKIGENVRPAGGNLPAVNRLSFDIIDQDLFKVFKDKYHTLFSGGYLDDEKYFNFAQEILNTTRNYETATQINGTPRKFINPDELFETIATIGKNDIHYKMDHSYGPGRMITLYGQSIEERDRIISILENSKVGQYFEDADNPQFRATIDADIEAKNAPVSKKFSGRFTTDYINLDYVDERGVPYIDLSVQSRKEDIDRIPRFGADFDPKTKTSKAAKYMATGDFTNPGEITALELLSRDIPEMGEMLHGKDGYVSPYATIEDVIEYRTGKRIQLSGRLAQPVVDAPPEVKKAIDPDVQRVVQSLGSDELPPGVVKPGPVLNVGRPVLELDKSVPVSNKSKNKKPKININVPDDILYDDDIPYSTTKLDDAIRRMDYVNLWENLLNEQDEIKRREKRERLEERNRQKEQKKKERQRERANKDRTKPVISTEESAPGPTKAGAEAVADSVVNSATTPQSPQARIIVNQTPNPPKPPKPRPSSGAPGRGAARQVDDATSAALAKGIKGADSLRMLGAAAILGVGVGGYSYVRRRTQQDNIDRRLEMQRKGIIS